MPFVPRPSAKSRVFRNSVTAAYLVIVAMVIVVWASVPSIREAAGSFALILCGVVLLGLCWLWATFLIR